MIELPKGKFQKHHHFYGKVELKLPTWENIIDNFNQCILRNSHIKGLQNAGFVMHDTFSEPLITYLDFVNTHNLSSVHYYVSLSELSETFGKHKDDSDVWWVSAIGTTEVTVWDEEEITYIMNPGDMIYLPKGMYHNTKPLTPRVGLSFGIDYEN